MKMTAVLKNDLAQRPEWSGRQSGFKPFFSPPRVHHTADLLQRTSEARLTVNNVTEYELEVRELADAAARESARCRAEAKALHRAGLEQQKHADDLQSQAEYYSQLIRH